MIVILLSPLPYFLDFHVIFHKLSEKDIRRTNCNLKTLTVWIFTYHLHLCNLWIYYLSLVVYQLNRILSRRKHVPGRHNQLVGSSQRSAAFSELNKEFHFLRRCNTLSTLSRYNSLPPNFVFKNKIRKLSSVKSQDSGIAVIDIHRNESFKHAVSSVNADDCVENETKPENEANLNEKSPEQEVTSISELEAEKTEKVGITGILELGVFEFLPVFGATDDEVDV